MKGLKKVLAAAVTVTAVMASWIIPVMADPYVYTPIAGTTTELTKFFIVDADVEIPDVTFNYTIDPISDSDAKDATDSTMAVLPGVAGATVAPVSFNKDSASYPSVQTGDSLTLPSGMKYCKDDITIDLTGCSFTEPGVYRYVLKEEQCANGAVTCDTTEKYLDVFIVDKNGATDSGELELAGYTIHTNDAAPAKAGGTLSDKIDSITNSYVTADLYIGKKVDGNQGSRDKFFKFTLEVTGLAEGTVLTVDLTNASAAVGDNAATVYAAGTANPTEMTADSDGKATADFYLQNGQYVIVYGLTENAGYTISEDAEDYTSQASSASSFTIGSVTFNGAVSGQITDKDSSGTISDDTFAAGFTNTREGTIPTGVITRVAPIVAVGIIVAAGIVIIAVRNVKRKAEEEA